MYTERKKNESIAAAPPSYTLPAVPVCVFRRRRHLLTLKNLLDWDLTLVFSGHRC